MSDINTATKIKNKIDKMKEDKHRAEGGLEQVMKLIKKDFGCGSIEEAEETLEQMYEELEVSRDALIKETERLTKKLDDLKECL